MLPALLVVLKRLWHQFKKGCVYEEAALVVLSFTFGHLV
jgi:hypothetical protein